MKKIVSVIAAAFAALTISSAAGAASLYETEAFQPFAVSFSVDTSGDNSEYSFPDEQAGAERLYLEDAELLTEQTESVAEETPRTFTAQDILKMAGISLAIGMVIALIICLIMKYRMKTARPRRTANDYIKKNSFHITRSRDIFIYADVTKRKRVKEESKK